MELSNLRRNPIDGSTSARAITDEEQTVAELVELPGIYGFNLQDRPVAGTVSIVTDDTAATPFTIVLTTPAPGQVFVDFNTQRGMCIFHQDDAGTAVLCSYDGLGSNVTTENLAEFATFTGKTTDDLTEGAVNLYFSLAEQTKLANIESGATKTPAGIVGMFAGAAAPSGYLACDGSPVSRTTYAALFAVISTTYGAGDGSTTFNVPDMRGLFVRGAGSHGTMTKAAGGAYAGGSVGSTSNDMMQGHKHEGSVDGLTRDPFGEGVYSGIMNYASSEDAGPASLTDVPCSDGTNGTPRTGDETKPASISLLYCIKY